MNLSQLKPKVKNKTAQRKGRGSGSGWGKTAGRGNKGAGQRSGKVLPYIGFRGGNLSFLRRIPKRGFNSHAKDYQIVNLNDIALRAKKYDTIDLNVLKELNLIKSVERPVKILAKLKDEYKLKAVIKANKFSLKAKALIEKAGGKAEEIVAAQVVNEK